MRTRLTCFDVSDCRSVLFGRTSSSRVLIRPMNSTVKRTWVEFRRFPSSYSTEKTSLEWVRKRRKKKEKGKKERKENKHWSGHRLRTEMQMCACAHCVPYYFRRGVLFDLELNLDFWWALLFCPPETLWGTTAFQQLQITSQVRARTLKKLLKRMEGDNFGSSILSSSDLVGLRSKFLCLAISFYFYLYHNLMSASESAMPPEFWIWQHKDVLYEFHFSTESKPPNSKLWRAVRMHATFMGVGWGGFFRGRTEGGGGYTGMKHNQSHK